MLLRLLPRKEFLFSALYRQPSSLHNPLRAFFRGLSLRASSRGTCVLRKDLHLASRHFRTHVEDFNSASIELIPCYVDSFSSSLESLELKPPCADSFRDCFHTTSNLLKIYSIVPGKCLKGGDTRMLYAVFASISWLHGFQLEALTFPRFLHTRTKRRG
jgi:hypothetical protein